MPAPRKFKFNFEKYVELRDRFNIPNPDNKCIICDEKLKSKKQVCAKCAIKIKKGTI